MEPDDAQALFDSYIVWIRTLRCQLTTALEPNHLVDCRAFAEVLHRIDDQDFPESWVDNFFVIAEEDSNSKWRIKGSHLKKVLEAVFTYLEKHANVGLRNHTMWKIDAHAFAALIDLNEINKLMNLIVGAAMLGRNKQEFVEIIQQQSDATQLLTMTAVRNITQNCDIVEAHSIPTSEPSNGLPSNSNGHPTGNNDIVDSLVKENDELKSAQTKLERELENLRQELHVLRMKPSVDDLERENDDLRTKKDRAEELQMDLEGRIDVLNLSLEGKDSELEKLKQKMSQLDVFEADYNQMKDELDELRSQELEHRKVARELEQLKHKSKDVLSDRTELNVLREKCQRYMADMVKLEDEQSKNKNLRQQIGALKAQKEEKEDEANKLIIRLNKIESELGEAKSKLMAAEKKNESYVHEKLQLKDKISELEMMPRDLSESLHNDLGSSFTSDTASDENRSRFLEQERELSRLRERVRELEELEEERREWQTTKGRNRELESELQIAIDKRIQLQETIERLEKELESASNGDTGVTQVRMQMEHQSIEFEKMRERAEMLERQVAQAAEAQKATEAVIAEKDKELATRGDHLKKAKQLLGDMESKMSSTEEGGMSMHQFDSLRREIEQKEKTIKGLQEQLLQSNTKHEEEQRLATTAYFEMAKQKNVTNTFDSPTPGDRSMLQKHRASTASVNSISVVVPWALLMTIFVGWLCGFVFRDLVKSPPDVV